VGPAPFQTVSKSCGFAGSHLIRAFGVSAPGEMEAHEEVIKPAEKTAGRVKE